MYHIDYHQQAYLEKTSLIGIQYLALTQYNIVGNGITYSMHCQYNILPLFNKCFKVMKL